VDAYVAVFHQNERAVAKAGVGAVAAGLEVRCALAVTAVDWAAPLEDLATVGLLGVAFGAGLGVISFLAVVVVRTVVVA